jgi:hypothetical protein
MLITDRQPPAIDSLSGERRQPVEEESDQPSSDAYVYTLRNEEAYLQTDEDEKPEIIAEPRTSLVQVLVLQEDRPAGAVRRGPRRLVARAAGAVACHP